ncbi:MAG: hypothetical protein H6747_13765 [Deltaproteobacteria bacterium]|nr:hypothetical protein [Deltaproteobacteria bacterium]
MLRLGVGFHFHPIQVAGPVACDRLREQIVAALADDTRLSWLAAPMRLPLQPVRFTDLIDALLRPLLRDDTAKGSGVVVDAANADPRDASAWRNWLRRCNEARDRIATALDASLVLILPGWLFGHLADEAPDLWSVRGYVALLPDGQPQQREAERARLQLVDSMDMRLRGDLDAGLRVLQHEILPSLKAVGDVRGAALAMGQVADILQDRGELDEALRIRREEELPVYERLGDVRSKAVTMGKIADVLYARDELDEALRIRREEQLPVYERLGDVRSLLVARANLAINLARRGRREDADEIASLLALAWRDANRLRLPEAEQIRALYNRILGRDAAEPAAEPAAEQ